MFKFLNALFRRNMMRAKASDFLPLIDQRKPIHLEAKKGFYCFYNIAQEWNMMLKDNGTTNWGAPLISNLFQKVDSLKDVDDILKVYDTEEWAEICSKRGPVEGAWISTCDCGEEFFGFYMSGFVDLTYSIDYQNKIINWYSIYDDQKEKFDTEKCPFCGCKATAERKQISPFLVTKDFSIVMED